MRGAGARIGTLLLAAVLTLWAPARAETVVAGLSRNMIDITASFDGSEIVVFGAVSRVAPPPEGAPLQVIVTIEGPSQPIAVRRKARRFGIWVNSDTVEVDAAPSFYAVATTGSFAEALTQTEDLRHRVSIPLAIRAVGTGVADTEEFTRALIRIREAQDLYQMIEGGVTLRAQTLFDTAIRLPANLVEGDYRARIFLTRGGEVVDVLTQDISVQKVGLERFIYNLAHDRPLVYGILSLAIAIAAGWLASAVFRYIRT